SNHAPPHLPARARARRSAIGWAHSVRSFDEPSSRLLFPGFTRARDFISSVENVMEQSAEQGGDHCDGTERFKYASPDRHRPRNARVFGQPIKFRLIAQSEHIDHPRSTAPRRVRDGRFFEATLFQLLNTTAGDLYQILLRAELQTSGRTCFDARRLQAIRQSVRTQCAFVDLLRFRVQPRDVKGASGAAVFAADAMLLLKVDDPVGILHDRARRRARSQTARILAMHALILCHQPVETLRPVRTPLDVFIETDQVPKISR